jgi:RNA polymerase sigma-70 factor (ECF subfamily)
MNRKAKAGGDGGRIEAARSEPRRRRPFDLAAFDRLVEKHQDRIFNLLCRLVGDENAAAELTEEVFIGCYRRLHDGAPAEVPAMMYRLAIAALESWREKRGEVAPRDSGGPTTDFASALSAGLWQLDPDARLAVVLRRLEGLTEAEIAEMTNWTAEDLRSHIDRGWTALKHTLQPWLLDESEVSDGRTAHKS